MSVEIHYRPARRAGGAGQVRQIGVWAGPILRSVTGKQELFCFLWWAVDLSVDRVSEEGLDRADQLAEAVGELQVFRIINGTVDERGAIRRERLLQGRG